MKTHQAVSPQSSLLWAVSVEKHFADQLLGWKRCLRPLRSTFDHHLFTQVGDSTTFLGSPFQCLEHFP